MTGALPYPLLLLRVARIARVESRAGPQVRRVAVLAAQGEMLIEAPILVGIIRVDAPRIHQAVRVVRDVLAGRNRLIALVQERVLVRELRRVRGQQHVRIHRPVPRVRVPVAAVAADPRAGQGLQELITRRLGPALPGQRQE